MSKRLRLSPQFLMLIEAALLGLFFIEGLRFLVGMLYTRTAGASLALTIQAAGAQPVTSTAPDPTLVSNEISFVIAMLGLPLLTLVFGRLRAFIVVPALLLVGGRALMANTTVLTPTASAGLVVGAGLAYLAFLVRYRAAQFPYFFLLGIGIDQIFRAVGNTLDPSWSAAFRTPQTILCAVAAFLVLVTLLWDSRSEREGLPAPRYGLLPFWGGIGLGGLLFIELALLALPNAVAGRAGYDYTLLVPLLMAATLLPIVPFVRDRARAFLGIFDGGLRGWLWMLILALLVVIGTRLQGALAGVALVLAQFGVSMLWFWLARPRTERDRSWAGLWLLLAALVFGVLVVFDLFTYEYAYVRNFSGDFTFLNAYIPPLLRSFRGLGLAVLLLGIFLAALPMTQTQRRIPWSGGSAFRTLFALLVVIAASAGAYYAALPPVVTPTIGVASLRVGTYNIHGGTDEFFVPSLDGIARTIRQSGASVVLLQEAEVGRMTSFGVDQPLWLARTLGMDRRFYGTVEGLRGLGVLSSVPIAYAGGDLLTSQGEQAGLQRVQITPAANTVIEIYNTWLGYLTETGGEALAEQQGEQQSQLAQIYTLIAEQHANGVLGRTLFGGTFNNVPDSPLIGQVRAAGFTDPFAGYPLEISATLVRSGVPRARLDYLFLRNLALAEGILVLDNAASDHRLTVAGIAVE